MGATVYDEHVAAYLAFVDDALAAKPSLFREVLRVIEQLLGGRLTDSRLVDLACGEGYLSRFLAPLGPKEILGVDLSSALVEEARRRTFATNVSFRIEDAQELPTVDNGSVDVVVSQMAMMDIADHLAVFRCARRVLRPNGAFVFSLLHPCFESPFWPPGEEHFLTNADGVATANVVRWYASEGYWKAEGAGVRGFLGSYHRTLSTYVNDLVGNGFRLEQLAEPVVPGGGLFSQVPRVLIVAAEAI